jgi:hypothetical protein
MSYGFNSIQLTEPQTTEWTRDTLNPSREPRWHEVRNMHGKVWRRANSPRGRI